MDGKESSFSIKNIFPAKNGKYRVLIIDMAYYQLVSKYDFDHLYPYANGMTDACANEIWSNRYATTTLEENARPDEEMLFLTRRLFEKIKTPKFVAVTTFKEAISDLIGSFSSMQKRKLSIYAISMLPGTEPAKPDDDPNPANWISVLCSSENLETIHRMEPRFPWDDMRRTNAEKAYIRKFENINDLREKEFDAIYLVKDNTLTPPHMDKNFLKLLGKAERVYNQIETPGANPKIDRFLAQN